MFASGCRIERNLPQHIGVILDGNRRWAERHGVSLTNAYMRGAVRVGELVSLCEEARIPVVTVFALSRDNMKRDPVAIGNILAALAVGLSKIAATGRWHVRPIGDLGFLPSAQTSQLRIITDRTSDRSWGTLNVAIAYDGRADIVEAVQKLIQDRNPEMPSAAAVSEADLDRHLSTAGQPDIDLVIRTSGEHRLSGFMPWQAAYAEYYVTTTAWPDFSAAVFADALNWYCARERRFGS
ncbi:short-chain Z-isoprenyl diphosphate synthase [Nocardia pseudobrasiliensis]|uniref:Isoprenyl transferase n=2 Tax=Nocardia pseudobrasiliensis TaxID=45979 RepID=A0A370IG68_9NOCA|nr:short-chain Z-isoprenyl diphosphate synthase [Nocardia pseudobrasiliensis]